MVDLSTVKDGDLFVRFETFNGFARVKFRKGTGRCFLKFDDEVEIPYAIDGTTRQLGYENIEEVVVPGTVDLSSSRRGRVMFQDGTVIDRANVEPINNGMFAVETEPLETWITYRADGTFADYDCNPQNDIIRFDPIPDEEVPKYVIVQTMTLVRRPVVTPMSRNAISFEIVERASILDLAEMLRASLSHEDIVTTIREFLKAAKEVGE